MIGTLDPSLTASGVALFTPGGTLERGELVRSKLSGPNLIQRAQYMGRLCASALRGAAAGCNARVELLIVEWPQIYKHERNKDPNDLPGLAAVAGAVALDLNCEARMYLPHDWKGSIDPDECTERIRERLKPEELAALVPCPASLAHNREDAVGIGLKFFGRFERFRVFPR